AWNSSDSKPPVLEISGGKGVARYLSGETSHKRTSGPRRRESVLAHTSRVARDSGIILWTAKMPFQVELVSIRPVHEKPIFHQLNSYGASNPLMAEPSSWMRWELPADTQVALLRVLQERQLLRARRCVKKTHQISDVGGLQSRPRYTQFLSAISHAGAMPPESGGEGNGGESFGARPKPGPNLCAFRHMAMASSATPLGENALANQGRSGWLEVAQAREKR